MQQTLKDAGWLNADFFTHSYRISGRLEVRNRTLISILNDPHTSVIQILDAYVSPIDRPGDIVAGYGETWMLKENVTLIVVSQREDALPQRRDYGTFHGHLIPKVSALVPTFEIRGSLFLSSRADMRLVLLTGTDRFLTLFEAQARSTVRPDIMFSGGAIMVNKEVVGAICVGGNEA